MKTFKITTNVQCTKTIQYIVEADSLDEAETKILYGEERGNGIEIISTGGYLQAKIKKPFNCDYVSAFKLCQIPESLSKQQLITFFEIVKMLSPLETVCFIVD